jgi:hypothetical protein
MAHYGIALFRGQGTPKSDSGVTGTYLTADQQCALSECFRTGALHSTHGVHPAAPNCDVFRLRNHPEHGFNSVRLEPSTLTPVPYTLHKGFLPVRFNAPKIDSPKKISWTRLRL